jgi:hypothetical protein
LLSLLSLLSLFLLFDVEAMSEELGFFLSRLSGFL